MKVSLKNIFFREIGCHSLWELILPKKHVFWCLFSMQHRDIYTDFFFHSWGEKKGLLSELKMSPTVLSKSPRSMFHFLRWMFSGSNNSSCPQLWKEDGLVFRSVTVQSNLLSLLSALRSLFLFFSKFLFVCVTFLVFQTNPQENITLGEIKESLLAMFPISIIIILYHWGYTG